MNRRHLLGLLAASPIAAVIKPAESVPPVPVVPPPARVVHYADFGACTATYIGMLDFATFSYAAELDEDW